MPKGESNQSGVGKVAEEYDVELYVFKESVREQEKKMAGLDRGIENERRKAGVLLGLFFLFIAQLFPHYSTLPSFWQGVVFVLVVATLMFIYQAFRSVKVAASIDVDENFEDPHSSEKQFLKEKFNVLKINEKEQKKLLTRISDCVRYAVVLTSVITLIFLFFMSDAGSGQKDQKPSMKPDYHEMDDKAIKSDGMKPDIREKGAGDESEK